MRLILLAAVACLSFSHFPTLSRKRRDFRKKIIEHKNAWFDFLYNFFSEIFLILRIIQLAIAINAQQSSGKEFVILLGF